jgi:hypothetical protein
MLDIGIDTGAPEDQYSSINKLQDIRQCPPLILKQFLKP